MNLLPGFCERGGRPDLPAGACHADQEGRALPPGQAGRQGLGVPVQQGAFQVLCKGRIQVHNLTIVIFQVNFLPVQQAIQW